MKSRPILFSSSMIRALLREVDPKTQTRRILKGDLVEWEEGWSLNGDHPVPLDQLPCPYGAPGGRLWVREEHYRFGHWEQVPGVQTKGGRQKWKFVADSDEVRYDENAPESFRKGRHHKDPYTPAWHKRLARFMPRALSRITLEITSVHLERLQHISEAEAKAEGATARSWLNRFAPHVTETGWSMDWSDVGTPRAHDGKPLKEHEVCLGSARFAFANYFDRINGPGSWDANPYVWVVEFKRVEGGAQ